MQILITLPGGETRTVPITENTTCRQLLRKARAPRGSLLFCDGRSVDGSEKVAKLAARAPRRHTWEIRRG